MAAPMTAIAAAAMTAPARERRSSRPGSAHRPRIAARLVLAVCTLAGCAPEPTLYFGGPILTMDDEGREVEALAVEGSRIAAAGSLEDLDAWARASGARRVDLAGRALLPGFVDAHSHFPGSGIVAVWADLRPVPMGSVASIDDLVARLSAQASRRPASDWVAGFGYDDTLLAEARHPTREDLDRVSSERPVFAWHLSGHAAAVNSVALARAGIDADSADPPGGRIVRDAASGRPTGVLEEEAVELVRARVPEFGWRELWTIVRSAEQAYLAQGVTTAQNGLAEARHARLLDWLSWLGLFDLRLVVWPALETAELVLAGELEISRDAPERLRLGAVKLVADGSIQTYTAHLAEPYARVPDHLAADWRGYPRVAPELLAERVARFHGAGWQIAVHGNGDAAIDAILDAFERAQRETPRADARHVIVHAQMARSDQLARMHRLGVTPSFFSLHTWYWGERHRQTFLGPERARRISPAAEAEEAGVRFTLHTDSPVTAMEPLRLVWAAVNRRTSAGRELGPEQRIAAPAALRAVTIDAAWQQFLDGDRGSLEPGKLADMVILSRSPLTDAAHIDEIRVLETIVGGRSVYRAAEP